MNLKDLKTGRKVYVGATIFAFKFVKLTYFKAFDQGT